MIGVVAGFRGRRGEEAVLWSADFTTLTPGAVSLASYGLSFSRASAATVQTGTSTVVTSGIGVDTPRAGRALDADSVGLVIEPARTNQFPYSTDVGNVGLTITGASGFTYTTGQASPDGGTIGTRIQQTSNTVARYYSTTATTGTFVMSQWVRRGSGSGVYQCWHGTSITAGVAATGTAGASWGRVATGTFTYAASTPVAVPSDGRGLAAIGGAGPLALDAVVTLAQFESGKWASEAIVTNGAPATRAGERPYLASGSSVVSAGRVSLHFRAQMKHSTANADTAWRLWSVHNDVTTYVEIATSGVLTVSVSGSTVTTPALSWAAGDVIDIFVAAGGGLATIAKYRANGGAVASVTGAALGTIAPSGAIDLLCDASAAKQPGARVYGLTFYRSGQAPEWAA